MKPCGLRRLAPSTEKNVPEGPWGRGVHRHEIPPYGEIPSYQMGGRHSMCPLTCWWTLGLFPCHGCRNHGPRSVGFQVFVEPHILTSVGYTPMSGIAGSGSNPRLKFERQRRHTFQGVLTLQHSHRQRTRVPVSSHSHKCLTISLFAKIITTLASAK